VNNCNNLKRISTILAHIIPMTRFTKTSVFKIY